VCASDRKKETFHLKNLVHVIVEAWYQAWFRLFLTKYHNKGTAYKQQKFISHSSGGWEVHHPGTFSVWQGPTHFVVHRWCLLAMPSYGGRGEGFLSDLFYKDTNAIYEASVLVIQ
jgi:hypothetical protein